MNKLLFYLWCFVVFPALLLASFYAGRSYQLYQNGLHGGYTSPASTAVPVALKRKYYAFYKDGRPVKEITEAEGRSCGYRNTGNATITLPSFDDVEKSLVYQCLDGASGWYSFPIRGK